MQRAFSAPKIKTPGSPGIVKTLGFGTPKTLGPITKIVQVPHSAHAPRAPALPLLLPPPLGHIHPLDPKSHPRRAHHTGINIIGNPQLISSPSTPLSPGSISTPRSSSARTLHLCLARTLPTSPPLPPWLERFIFARCFIFARRFIFAWRFRRFIFAWLKHCRHLHPSLAHHPSSLNSNAAGFLYSSLSHSLIIFIRLKHCRISLLFTHLKSQSVFSHSPSMTSTPGLSHRHTLTLPQLPTHSTRLIFEPSHTDSDVLIACMRFVREFFAKSDDRTRSF
ncbi:uncharacterized protein PGTG_13231 [Puccinia graminis f. sp. tritici CRL 75-36-700-3]|uniref:Uncharacterized protein n=1 Tax=Puccinia graminis f. sp. tritici (strain CRL 75-36-700-3 / race SCCL) TaxID=418459 RepID=E3KRC4_PUCGT|nr:uncharacterized protein PGTG_13231 [Puccinia graminis f. sp. tritici CRL 75-36-700-3]EFP86849.1 hypothetical protein PGTG_13231 [Puccinia graminis f. sp. tritici CRL 75-36-700-3]